jgi:transposase
MDFAVINETGKITLEKKIPTGAREFINVITSISRPRKIYIEEGELASWLLDVCVKLKEELIITDPKSNKWIGLSNQKNDKLDARKLAQLARGGYIKEIHHPVGNRRRLKELVMSYYDVIKLSTMIKNKIKSKFRQNGICCQGATVYIDKYRENWKEKLPEEETLYVIVEGLWKQLDEIKKFKKELLKQLLQESKKYPEIKRFMNVPGIGFIRAVTISAIIETPERFSNKRKLWMYAGLGMVKKSSGKKVYSERLTNDYNRLLKVTIRQSVLTAISSKDNHFRRQYLRLVMEQGILPHRAKLTVGRSILAVIYGMWKNNEPYNPEKIKDKYKEEKKVLVTI